MCTDLPRLGVGVSLQFRGCHFSGGGARGQHPRATPTSNPTTTHCNYSLLLARLDEWSCSWLMHLGLKDTSLLLTDTVTPTQASPRETRVGGEEGH